MCQAEKRVVQRKKTREAQIKVGDRWGGCASDSWTNERRDSVSARTTRGSRLYQFTIFGFSEQWACDRKALISIFSVLLLFCKVYLGPHNPSDVIRHGGAGRCM